MLDRKKLASIGKIPVVTWNTPDGFDKLGVIAQPRGVLFVRRDDSGQLGRLFVPYVFTATKFGGWRAWFGAQVAASAAASSSVSIPFAAVGAEG
jgi:hypothetical protein